MRTRLAGLWVLFFLGGCEAPALAPDASSDERDDAAGLPRDDASGDAQRSDAPSDAGPPISLTCADAYGASVCSGTADPTALGSGIEPVRAGIIAGDPGSHYYRRPADTASWNGRLLLHLVGTYGDPRDDNRFPERACSLGYAAVAPMYENRDDARSTCEDDAACYEAFHAEIVDGVEGSPVDVDTDDSILARSASLLDALAASDPSFSGWATLEDELATMAWPSVVVSGHSQGSGHALYIARDREVRRLVILAGPADQLRDGEPDHTPPPWVTELSVRAVTPVDRFFAYIHLDDTLERIPQVFASWDAMGLGAACDYAQAGGYDAGCRRILIPADDCLGLNAHSTVVVRTWGPMCRLGAAGSDNVATWAFLPSETRGGVVLDVPLLGDDEPVLARRRQQASHARGELASRLHAELAEHAVDLLGDGAPGAAAALRDLAIRPALSQELEDLELGRRERAPTFTLRERPLEHDVAVSVDVEHARP